MQGMSCLHPLQIHLVAGCKLLRKSEFQKWHKWKQRMVIKKSTFAHELPAFGVSFFFKHQRQWLNSRLQMKKQQLLPLVVCCSTCCREVTQRCWRGCAWCWTSWLLLVAVRPQLFNTFSLITQPVLHLQFYLSPLGVQLRYKPTELPAGLDSWPYTHTHIRIKGCRVWISSLNSFDAALMKKKIKHSTFCSKDSNKFCSNMNTELANFNATQ